MTLIITNGDIVADTLKTAGVAQSVVPWRDTLVDGPVPLTTDLETLDTIRAAYLSDAFLAPRRKIEEDFALRRALLDRLGEDERIELWFEHDLYDQLQLVQVLDALTGGEGERANVMLVQADDYLGCYAPDAITRFADQGRALDQSDFEIASRAWAAYRSPTPESFAALANDPGVARLRFLKAAMVRALEELPGMKDGLSRTERRILEALGEGLSTPSELLADNGEHEEGIFLADWSFWLRLEGLAFAPSPLISGLAERFGDMHHDGPPDPLRLRRYLDARLVPTDLGRAVLEGRADHVATNGIDRWWGGTHLTPESLWRWDAEEGRLAQAH